MTAKEYFVRVQEAERELYMIRQQRRHVWEVVTGNHGMSETGIRSPSDRSRVETAGITMVDLDAKFDACQRFYEQIVIDAQELIKRLPQIRFREVLTLRYLCGHSWRTISDEMEFNDPKSVYRVHGLALLAVQKIIGQDTT